MSDVRIGFLGCGTVAHLHADAIARTPGVRLVAVHDPDPQRALTFRDDGAVAVAPDVATLIGRDDLDAVFVLTPTESHADLAHRCLDAGHHVLVEKPVAEDAETIRALAAHARRSRQVVVPGHNYLHLPECARLVRQARGGDLGRVRALFVTYAIAHPESLAAQYAGVLAEVMVHHAYLALAILGRPDVVHGGVSVPGWRTLTSDDQAWMTWQYADGALAQLFGTFAVDDLSDSPVTFAVKALGTRGTAAFNWRSSSTLDDGPFRLGMPLYAETYLHQCAAFRDAVLHRTPSASTLDDAADVAEILASVAHPPPG